MTRRLIIGLGCQLAALAFAAGTELYLASGATLTGSPYGFAALLVTVAVSVYGLAVLSAVEGRAIAAAVPSIFAGLVVFLWDAIARGYAIPAILLPAPPAIVAAIHAFAYDLSLDFWQTFVRAALPGFAIGSASGFIAAVAVDRSPFLQRGLKPIANLLSVVPIVGVAPIMVMWFGFDWPSKAAVVTLMTFFPTLVGTLAGLQAAGTLERELMASYSASYWQTLLKLRLPAALPFVFAALKVNATLAVIGAIVAEFFGAPTYGIGFRISTEIGRLGLDRVWAAIVVAAFTGSAFYGALALAERLLTFWHPSVRGART